MYKGQNSIQVFKRIHARDRINELARHVGDRSSDDDLDVFGAHARAESTEGIVSIVLSIATIALLIGIFFLLWK
jgi:hypothetical protein